MKPRQGQSQSQKAINIAAVTIPSPPPASPENTFTPPPTVNQEPPKPIPQPDPVAPRPISTPIPRNTPIPTPSPQASTPAMTPTATPTPNPLASSRPTPNPAMTIAPTAPPTMTPAQVKEFREQKAKVALKEKFGLDDSYQLPVGETYESMLKQLSPEAQKELDDAVAAYNKSVFDKFNPTLVATPNPNATPDPNASSSNPNNPGDPNGDPNGTGSGIFNNSDPNREINNIDRKVNDFDPALVDPSSNPFGKPNLNSNGIDNNVPFSGNPLDDSERELERGIDVPTSLANPRPSPTPIPLPDYRSTATGWTFPYDGRSFAVTVPDGIEEGQSILINSLVKTRPRDTSKSFELIWKLQWESNTNLLIKAVIDEYEIRKKSGL